MEDMETPVEHQPGWDTTTIIWWTTYSWVIV